MEQSGICLQTATHDRRYLEAAAALGMEEDEVYCELSSGYASLDPFTAKMFGTDEKLVLNNGPDDNLLEALRAAGLEVGSTCETGEYGTCTVAVRCGKVDISLVWPFLLFDPLSLILLEWLPQASI